MPLPGADEAAITRVVEGRVKVEPAFASPEMILHPISADQRADVFSAGACLYFMLTGEVPFANTVPRDNPNVVFDRHMHDPKKLNPDIPQAVLTVMNDAMEAHEADRYREPADMKEVVDELLEEM
jgi:serine/threonine protein kinase